MSDQETSEQSSRFSVTAAVLLFVVIGVPLLVFLPLILAFVEGLMFGTREVEEFFKRIGLHDELSAIYEPVTKIFPD